MADLIDQHLHKLHRTAQVNQDHRRGRSSTYHSFLATWIVTEQPKIPAPHVFDGLADEPSALNDDRTRLPTVAECAAHLKLIEAILTLRRRVLASRKLDAVFNLEPNIKTVHKKKRDRTTRKWVWEEKKVRDHEYPKKRKQVWERDFLPLAVARFRVWAKSVDAELKKGVASDEIPVVLSLPFMPPLDVLMVWHSFLLNPADYLRYCDKYGLRHLPRVAFPWLSIHERTDLSRSTACEYKLRPDEKEWFENVTHLHGGAAYTISPGEPYHVIDDFVADLERITDANPLYSVLRRDAPLFPTGAPPIQAALEKQNISGKDRALLLAMEEAQLCVTDRELEMGIEDPMLSGEQRERREETFAMVAMVQRQAGFVDKMHQHLWLRSPAFPGTLKRALDRYDKFVQLFKLYPDSVLVPTLDIDIVWHTHQCSAFLYRDAMVKRVGKFINHDDKYGQASLDTGLEKTEDFFQLQFGQRYSRCLCWECEAMLSVVEDADKAGTLETIDEDELGKKVFSRVMYYRETEIARRTKRQMPRADQEPI